MIASRTTHEVTCPLCHFRKILPTMQQAKKVDLEHEGFHRNFAVGTRVLTPLLRGMQPTQLGKIETIYSNWDEAFVKLDKKTECYQCDHKHMKDQWWRGPLSELVKA